MEGWLTQFSATEEFEAKPRHLLAKLPVLPHQWKVSLKLKPTSLGRDLQDLVNVIFLSNGPSNFNKRFSALGIWLHGNLGVKITSGVNTPHFSKWFGGVGSWENGEFNGKLAKKLRNGEEWVDIQISQEFVTILGKMVCGYRDCHRTEEKKLMYRVIIDGVEELSLENKTPQLFENVKLYTGFSISKFHGKIKELTIKIKEDDLVKYRLTKIKNNYSKEPPAGELYALGPSFKQT